MSELDEIQARIADCATYNFGMRNADKLAHEDAPRLLAAVRAANAAMFSAEAVERAARVLVEVGQFGVPWEDASDRDRAETIDLARTVIAALGVAA